MNEWMSEWVIECQSEWLIQLREKWKADLLSQLPCIFWNKSLLWDKTIFWDKTLFQVNLCGKWWSGSGWLVLPFVKSSRWGKKNFYKIFKKRKEVFCKMFNEVFLKLVIWHFPPSVSADILLGCLKLYAGCPCCWQVSQNLLAFALLLLTYNFLVS